MTVNRAIKWGLSAICLAMGVVAIGCSTPGGSAALISEHPLVRKAAIERLGEHPDMASYNALVKALRADPDRLVRSQAAFAVGRFNQRFFSVGFAPLVEALETDSSVFVRAAAATALSSNRDSRAVAVLVEALDDQARGEVSIVVGDRTVTYKACVADAARTSLEKIVGLKYISQAQTAKAQRDEIAAKWTDWYRSAQASLPNDSAVATK
jgi:HEAT repeat protein